MTGIIRGAGESRQRRFGLLPQRIDQICLAGRAKLGERGRQLRQRIDDRCVRADRAEIGHQFGQVAGQQSQSRQANVTIPRVAAQLVQPLAGAAAIGIQSALEGGLVAAGVDRLGSGVSGGRPAPFCRSTASWLDLL